jgi:hypothetical protein
MKDEQKIHMVGSVDQTTRMALDDSVKIDTNYEYA